MCVSVCLSDIFFALTLLHWGGLLGVVEGGRLVRMLAGMVVRVEVWVVVEEVLGVVVGALA